MSPTRRRFLNRVAAEVFSLPDLTDAKLAQSFTIRQRRKVEGAT